MPIEKKEDDEKLTAPLSIEEAAKLDAGFEYKPLAETAPLSIEEAAAYDAEPTGLAYVADVADKTRQRVGLSLLDTMGGIASAATEAGEYLTSGVTKKIGKVAPSAQKKIEDFWEGQHQVDASAVRATRDARAEIPYSLAVQKADADGTWFTTWEWYAERVPETIADIGVMVAGEYAAPGSGLLYGATRAGTAVKNERFLAMVDEGIAPEVARRKSSAQGAVAFTTAYVTSKLAMPHLMGKAVPGPLAKKIAESTGKRLAASAAGKAVSRVASTTAGKVAGKVVAGGAAEGLQEVAEGVSQDTAQWLIENDDEAFEGGLQRRLQEFVLGFVSGGAARGVTTVINERGQKISARAQAAADRIGELSSTPEGMKKLRKLVRDSNQGRKAFEDAGLGKDLRLNAGARKEIIAALTPDFTDVHALAAEFAEATAAEGGADPTAGKAPESLQIAPAAEPTQTTPFQPQIQPEPAPVVEQFTPPVEPGMEPTGLEVTEQPPATEDTEKRQGRPRKGTLSFGEVAPTTQQSLEDMYAKVQETTDPKARQTHVQTLVKSVQDFQTQSKKALVAADVKKEGFSTTEQQTVLDTANKILTEGPAAFDDVATQLESENLTYEDIVSTLRTVTGRVADQQFAGNMVKRLQQTTTIGGTPQQKSIAKQQRVFSGATEAANFQIQMLDALSESLPHRALSETEVRARIIQEITTDSDAKFEDLERTMDAFVPGKSKSAMKAFGQRVFSSTKGEFEPIYRSRQLSKATVKKHKAAVLLLSRDIRRAMGLNPTSKLRGDVEAAMASGNVDILPTKLQGPVTSLRAHMDAMSNALIDTGAILATYADGDMRTKLPTIETVQSLRDAIQAGDEEGVAKIKSQLHEAKHPRKNVNLLVKTIEELGAYRKRTHQAFSDVTWRENVPADNKRAAAAKFKKDMVDDVQELRDLVPVMEESRAQLRDANDRLAELMDMPQEEVGTQIEAAHQLVGRLHEQHQAMKKRRNVLSRKFKNYAERSGQKIEKRLTKKLLEETELSGADFQKLADSKVEEVLSWAHEIAKTQKDGGDTGRVETQRKKMLETRSADSEVVRQLLGEQTDTLARYAETVEKQAKILAAHEFIGSIKKLGMEHPDGRFLWTQNDPKRPKEASYRVAAESTSALAPLNGMYTFPEIIDSFRSGEANISDPSDVFFGLRTLGQLEGAVRSGLTVWSPGTHFRQVVGNLGLMSASGNLSFLHPVASFKIYDAGAKAAWAGAFGTGDSKSRELLLDAVNHGVAGENVTIGDLKLLRKGDKTFFNRLVADAFGSQFVQKKLATTTSEKLEKAGRLYEKIAAAPELLYQAEDDGPRIAVWLGERARLTRINEGAPAGKKISEAAIKREAAIITRKVFQTYSEAGLATQKLRRIGLGPFVSFPIEVLRTQTNIVAQAIKEVSMTDNPAAQVEAKKRIGSFIATHAMAGAGAAAVTKAIAQMLGWGGFRDDEKEAALRDHVAPWNKLSSWIMLPQDKDGRYRFLDIDSINPFSSITTPLKALFREGPTAAVGAFADPATAEPIIGGAIIDAMRNTKASGGGDVYNPTDTPAGIAKSVGMHVQKAGQPGWLRNVLKMVKAAQGEVGAGGKAYSLMDELMATLGSRVTTIDMPESLRWEGRKYARDMMKATQFWSAESHKAGKATPKSLYAAREKSDATKQRLFEGMLQKVESAQVLDVTKADIGDILRASGVGKEMVEDLMAGERRQIEPRDIAEATQMVRALPKSASKERKAFLERRRRQLVGSKVMSATSPGTTATSVAGRASAQEVLIDQKIGRDEQVQSIMHNWMDDHEPGRNFWSDSKIERLHRLKVTPAEAVKVYKQIETGPTAPIQTTLKGKPLAQWLVGKWAASGVLQAERGLTSSRIEQLVQTGVSPTTAIQIVEQELHRAEVMKGRADLAVRQKAKRARKRIGGTIK